MIKKESTDAQLVSAYMKGNEQAISVLITRHKQRDLQLYLFKSI